MDTREIIQEHQAEATASGYCGACAGYVLVLDWIQGGDVDEEEGVALLREIDQNHTCCTSPRL